MAEKQPFVIRTNQAPATSSEGGTVGTFANRETTFIFPVAPVEVNITRIPLAYSEIPRPGRKPLLQVSGRQLLQVSATFVVISAEEGGFLPAQQKIEALQRISQTDAALTIAFPGVPSKPLWRITDLRISSTARDENNNVTVAKADVTFTEFLARPAVVPGSVLLKDVPASRSTSRGKGATSKNQRAVTGAPNTGLADAVKAIMDKGPAGNPGGTTGSPAG